jgi:hypothetical protein
MGHESGRITPEYNQEMYLDYNAINKITISNGLCIFTGVERTTFSVAGNLPGVE